MRANPDGEWETTVPRSRRRGGGASGSGARHGSAAGGSSSADGSGAYADADRGPPSVHLKHVSADAPLSGGKRMAIGEHNSDEGHSDETQLLNEEDWSSAGSAEDSGQQQPSSTTTTAAGAAVVAASAAAGVSPSVSSKKRAAASSKAGFAKPASDGGKPKGRGGMKEFNDAQPLESRAPSLLASIDLEMIAGGFGRVVGACERLVAVPIGAVFARTPHTQAWLGANGTKPHVQLLACMLLVVLMMMVPTDGLPPALLELAQSRWVEVPLGVGLVIQFGTSDLGGRLWGLCAPTASGGRHA